MTIKMRTLDLVHNPPHPIPIKIFTLSELEKATNNFINVLGCGGFSVVYKGRLADGRFIAVKKLSPYSVKAEWTEEFETEISVAKNTTPHPNLVRLIRFCIEYGERFLVYPFMANGSLEMLMRKVRNPKSLFDWSTRKRIALGIAKGLVHLHNLPSGGAIVHRDVKPANILLDEDFNAVIADFGIAKPVSSSGLQPMQHSCSTKCVNEVDERGRRGKVGISWRKWRKSDTFILRDTKSSNYTESYTVDSRGVTVSCWQRRGTKTVSGLGDFTNVAGTSGYMPRELSEYCHIIGKIDAFAYGVVILQLVSGRWPFERDVYIVDWVKEMVRIGKTEMIVDSDLGGEFAAAEVLAMIKLGLLCTQNCPIKRPNMWEVVRMLTDGKGLAERWDEYCRKGKLFVP